MCKLKSNTINHHLCAQKNIEGGKNMEKMEALVEARSLPLAVLTRTRN